MKRFVAEFAVQHGISARDKRMKKHQVNQKHTHTQTLLYVYLLTCLVIANRFHIGIDIIVERIKAKQRI